MLLTLRQSANSAAFAAARCSVINNQQLDAVIEEISYSSANTSNENIQ